MPGDIYPAHVLWRLYLICYAPSINHFLCCVPVHNCSEYTRETALCVPREGAAQLHVHTELLHVPVTGHAVATISSHCPSFRPFSLASWCSLSFLEACCATGSRVGYAHLPTTLSPCAAPIPPNLPFTQDFPKTAPPSAQVPRPCRTNQSPLETSAMPWPRVLQPLPLSAWGTLVVPTPPATHRSSH